MSEHEDIREIMEEAPGGENHGRRVAAEVGARDKTVPLSSVDHQTEEFLRDGGFTMRHTKNAQDSGMVAHRGVLHPDEYVSPFELQKAVEAELGFAYAQIRAVYRQGPLSTEQRQLREQIDARLLALRRSGGNLTELAKAIGFEVNASGHVRAFDNAMSRARAIEQWREALAQ